MKETSALSDIEKIRTEFVEKIGMVAQGEGLPRIAGRVFGLLVFDGEPQAFGDLSERLQVSRGSISSSVRLLEERGLIKRTSKLGARQDFFQLAPNAWATMIEGAKKRTSAAHSEIATTIDELPFDATSIRERLGDYANFYQSIDDGLGVALKSINKRRSTDAST